MPHFLTSHINGGDCIHQRQEHLSPSTCSLTLFPQKIIEEYIFPYKGKFINHFISFLEQQPDSSSSHFSVSFRTQTPKPPTKMMRNKIKIKKIDYLPARQVTFSKRRRGLFKKAAELSVLCESEVAVVIFSATGKLFDYSSSSTKDVIERYNADMNGVEKSNNQVIELQLENENHIKLSKELEEKSRQLRQMKGQDIEGLNLDELLKLEQLVEASLGRVMETKEELIKTEIMELERKGAELVEANNQLRQTMLILSGGNTGPALMDQERLNNNIEGGGEEEGMSAESAISTTCNSAVSLSLEDDSSDEVTLSLKLGKLQLRNPNTERG